MFSRILVSGKNPRNQDFRRIENSVAKKNPMILLKLSIVETCNFAVHYNLLYFSIIEIYFM